jgi:hypothetical protein
MLADQRKQQRILSKISAANNKLDKNFRPALLRKYKAWSDSRTMVSLYQDTLATERTDAVRWLPQDRSLFILEYKQIHPLRDFCTGFYFSVRVHVA